MIKAGVLTLSDKGAQGKRFDESGPIIQEILRGHGIETGIYEIIPDAYDMIVDRLKTWTDELALPLIVTTGGTGLAPRDVTPDATLAVIERRVPGMEEAMRMESLKKTPHAMISRAVVGVRKRTLIVNLPGSPKAVQDCLGAVISALPHALAKLSGDMSECA